MDHLAASLNHADAPQTAPSPAMDPALDEALEEAQRKLAVLNERALTFIRARPVECLVGALAVGFIVGRLAARA